jgi:transcriptional regulator GlxA family with amidase domain
LQGALREAFSQLAHLHGAGEAGLRRALIGMAWDALREQLEAPPRPAHQDLLCARVKSFVESRLEDPDLSVESIAQACGMSVRSLHRAFAADPAGSVSHYVWMGRLRHCAADLRDPTQAHRTITDICFAWGFNSSSHFSRIFKGELGVAPRDYRAAFKRVGRADHAVRAA